MFDSLVEVVFIISLLSSITVHHKTVLMRMRELFHYERVFIYANSQALLTSGFVMDMIFMKRVSLVT